MVGRYNTDTCVFLVYARQWERSPFEMFILLSRFISNIDADEYFPAPYTAKKTVECEWDKKALNIP